MSSSTETATPKPPGATRETPARRGPGRPRKAPRAGGHAGEAAPDLRARLLDVAIECFAHHGISGATLREIAAEAGVNPALVHYYFGDKAQLQQAVIVERLMPAFDEVRKAVLESGDDTTALIAAFVRAMCETIERHPWLPSLWVREVLCEGGALRELLVGTIAPQIPQLLAARFVAAQEKGELNPDLDPRLLVTSLIGLTLFPAAGAPIWRRLFQSDDIETADMARHATALLDRGIAPV